MVRLYGVDRYATGAVDSLTSHYRGQLVISGWAAFLTHLSRQLELRPSQNDTHTTTTTTTAIAPAHSDTTTSTAAATTCNIRPITHGLRRAPRSSK